jgi:hypothetical protein
MVTIAVARARVDAMALRRMMGPHVSRLVPMVPSPAAVLRRDWEYEESRHDDCEQETHDVPPSGPDVGPKAT